MRPPDGSKAMIFWPLCVNNIAFEPSGDRILWHSTLMAAPSAGPITYTLDGRQYLLVCAGDSLYSFAVNQPSLR